MKKKIEKDVIGKVMKKIPCVRTKSLNKMCQLIRYFFLARVVKKCFGQDIGKKFLTLEAVQKFLGCSRRCAQDYFMTLKYVEDCITAKNDFMDNMIKALAKHSLKESK